MPGDSLSKQQCLQLLAKDVNRDWGHIVNAWNILHDFIKPRLSSSLIEWLRSQSQSRSRTFKSWVRDEDFPTQQLLNLALTVEERNKMLKSICFHIADSDSKTYKTALASVKRPRDSEEVEDDPAHSTEDNSKPPRKRVLYQRKYEPLPDTTKIYFMEEGKQDTRTGIMVTLLSNVKPEDGKVDIKTLLWGNATRRLAKRSIFDKKKHQLFYHDLENHKVRVKIDSCASFRSAVEEMHIHGKSKHSIQFCFRPKDEETRDSVASVKPDIAPVTPVSNKRYGTHAPVDEFLQIRWTCRFSRVQPTWTMKKYCCLMEGALFVHWV